MSTVRYSHKSSSSIIERKKIRVSNRGATIASPITKEFDLSKEKRMLIRKIRHTIKNNDIGQFRSIMAEKQEFMDSNCYNLALTACVENSRVHFTNYICQIFDNINSDNGMILDLSYPINQSIRNNDVEMLDFIVQRDLSSLAYINDFSIRHAKEKNYQEVINFLKEKIFG